MGFFERKQRTMNYSKDDENWDEYPIEVIDYQVFWKVSNALMLHERIPDIDIFQYIGVEGYIFKEYEL